MAVVNKNLAIALALACFVGIAVCESNFEQSVEAGRTFGHHFLKRISFAIIPTAFVVGVITTLLGALTIVSIKSLGVGLVLLILTVGQMIARGTPHAVPFAHAAPLSGPVPLVYKDW